MKVLTIGSSSTSGIGASSPVATYPTRLEGELESQFPRVDIEVINRGVPGEVEDDAAERIKLEVTEAQPDLVVWQVGTSDALARVDLDNFKEILGQTLDWLRENNFDVVVVDPQFTQGVAQNEHYLEIVKAIEETAHAHRVPLVRRFEAMSVLEQAAPRQRFPALDQFRVNDMGYRCLAEHAANAIVLGILAAEADASSAQAR